MNNILKKEPRFQGPLKLMTGCLTLVALLPVAAQDSGLGEYRGRVSVGEQSQGSEQLPSSDGRIMPGSEKDPSQFPSDERTQLELEAILAADTTSMETVIAQSLVQPPVEQTVGIEIDSQAEQIAREQSIGENEDSADGEVFLVLVLRITSDGESEVLSATEMMGNPRFSDEALSDYVFEVTDSGETLGLQSLSMDPFEAHSFGGGPDSPEGHNFERLEESTLTVRVPKRSLDSSLDGVSLKLYKLEPGAEVLAFSQSAVEDLKNEQRLRPVISIDGADISATVRKIGTRLEQ